MTNLPRSELVGVLAPYSINTIDIGVNWLVVGNISSGSPIHTVCNLGGGIAIAGADNGHIYRSVDYGNTWSDLGAIVGVTAPILSSVYCGNGIALFGDSGGHIFRSTDFGVNWTVGTTIANSPSINTLEYGGFGHCLAGTGVAAVTGNSIFRSLNFGSSFPTQVFGPGANPITTISYLENNIVIAGDNGGNIFRSTNQGATWAANPGNPISANAILSSAYLSRGQFLFGDSAGTVFQSSDYGKVFSISAGIGFTLAESITYLGNGIVIVCGFDGANGKVARNTDFASSLTYTILGTPTAAGVTLFSSAYLGNGVVIASDAGGVIYRSDISYKIDEGTIIDPSLISTTSSITIGQSINTVLADATGGNITIFLGDATRLQRGHEFTIKKTDGSANTVTISPAVFGQKIDGVAANVILNTQNQSFTIRTDTVNFFSVSLAASTFISLTDTPASYAGAALDVVRVNSGTTALEFLDPGTNFTIGQLNPNFTRYSMPGWGLNVITGTFTPTANLIYYVPLYVPETTTYLDISISNNLASTGTIDCIIYAWNVGVPGAQISNIGTFTWAGGASGQRTININLTLNRGFYFMAFRNSTGTVNGLFFTTSGAPVYHVTDNATDFGSGNPTNNYTMTVSAALADPAPAPTAMSGNNIQFMMKEHV